MKPKEISELERTYYYPGGYLANVRRGTHIEFLRGGIHKISTHNGGHIIMPGWYHLEIRRK